MYNMKETIRDRVMYYSIVSLAFSVLLFSFLLLLVSQLIGGADSTAGVIHVFVGDASPVKEVTVVSSREVVCVCVNDTRFDINGSAPLLFFSF